MESLLVLEQPPTMMEPQLGSLVTQNQAREH